MTRTTTEGRHTVSVAALKAGPLHGQQKNHQRKGS
jgi:hypothetical protein